MPMPHFPYGQGDFCRRSNEVYLDPAKRGPHMTAVETRIRANTPLEAVSELADMPTQQTAHFGKHWIPASKPYSPSYPYVRTEDVEKAIADGNLNAIKQAQAHAIVVNGRKVPLPISTAWICNGSVDTFEVVTIVNEGLNVMLLISSPPPFTGPAGLVPHQAEPDKVWVTRKLRSQFDLDEVKDKLRKAGDPNPKVLDRNGGDAGAGEVGTYQVWT